MTVTVTRGNAPGAHALLCPRCPPNDEKRSSSGNDSSYDSESSSGSGSGSGSEGSRRKGRGSAHGFHQHDPLPSRPPAVLTWAECPVRPFLLHTLAALERWMTCRLSPPASPSPTWAACFPCVSPRALQECAQVVTPAVPLSADSWRMSFGKFLEMFFLDPRRGNLGGACPHSPFRQHSRFFARCVCGGGRGRVGRCAKIRSFVQN